MCAVLLSLLEMVTAVPHCGSRVEQNAFMMHQTTADRLIISTHHAQLVGKKIVVANASR